MKAGADHFASDCPMAAEQIAGGVRWRMLHTPRVCGHPMTLLGRRPTESRKTMHKLNWKISTRSRTYAQAATSDFRARVLEHKAHRKVATSATMSRCCSKTG